MDKGVTATCFWAIQLRGGFGQPDQSANSRMIDFIVGLEAQVIL